ncbi:hypothetical protein ACLBXM_17995 [Xanthobacteraceae bacterium A53D]
MLTYPRALPMGYGYGDLMFTLNRIQVGARTAGGYQAAERSRSLWQIDMTVPALGPDAYEEMQAFFDSMRGGLNNFTAYDFFRRRPRAYPGNGWAGITRHSGAAFNGTGTLAAANAYQVSLSNLPTAYKVMPGDMISWPWRNTRTLHRVMEPVTASAGALTVQVEPDIPPGTVGTPTVKLEAADAVFKLVSPNPWQSARRQTRGAPFTFQALQVLR